MTFLVPAIFFTILVGLSIGVSALSLIILLAMLLGDWRRKRLW